MGGEEDGRWRADGCLMNQLMRQHFYVLVYRISSRKSEQMFHEFLARVSIHSYVEVLLCVLNSVLCNSGLQTFYCLSRHGRQRLFHD